MQSAKKQIIQHGNSLVVSLTKELNNLKLKKGESMEVIQIEDLIILTRPENSDKRFLVIKNDDYTKLRYLIKTYENKTFEVFFEEWVKEQIEKYGNFWKRPTIRLK